ncbi:chemotaxis protein CheX [Motilibacter deserti]|uniref:Chemotaxis protein CheX n=1 Tax=Motilibacter deserti TaxID=2714956 RepID=A0ABX0GZ25_9ACTN|nr:chemotaxis protein CheX [Motilibacter deserti]NHC16057.1 chemotaxis protein CheX [Motilibacter deserti]
MTATLAVDDLLAIAGDLWTSYLGSEPTPSVPGVGKPAQVTASVSIAGEWDGVVVVSLSAKTAQDVGSALLQLDAADLEPGDVDDAVGELVNIVGGNVKSVLPGPSSLSLPVVAHGTAHVASRGAEIVAQAALEWLGEHVEITVWSSTSTEGASS